jgi:hypothetical protein
VLNFDELADALIDYLRNGITIDLGSVTVDTHTMEQLLQDIENKIQGIDYSNLINALNALGAKLDSFASQIGQSGIPTIVGEVYDIGTAHGYNFEFNIDFEGYITGITFSQSNQAYNSKDNLDITLSSSANKDTPLFKTVYPKGFGEYKYLTVFKPVSPGDKIQILYRNPSEDTKVLWIDFHCLKATHPTGGGGGDTGGGSTGGGSTTPITTAEYLDRFIARPGDVGYVDPSTLELDYWTMAAEAVPNNFWQGRNYLLDQLNRSSSDGSRYSNSIITVTDYHNYLYQLHVDIRKHGLVLSDWPSSYITFIDKCNTTKAMGGYNLMSLNKAQQMQIYLTYVFQTVTLVFPSCVDKLSSDYIERFKSNLDTSKLWVLEWIDFSEVNPEQTVGAFNFDLGDTGDLKTFRTYMNVEPSALDPATFNASTDEVLYPFFIEEYHSGTVSTGTGAMEVSFFPGIYWDTKKAPLTYYLNDDALMTIRIFCHELGHGIDAQYGTINGTKLSDMPAWRNIGGWGLGDAHSLVPLRPEKWASECTTSDTEPPISLYGCTLVYEDFAEAYSCYCLNPTYLRDYYPKRYNFIETYVKGFKPYHGST